VSPLCAIIFGEVVAVTIDSAPAVGVTQRRLLRRNVDMCHILMFELKHIETIVLNKRTGQIGRKRWDG